MNYNNGTSFNLLEFQLHSIKHYCIWYFDPNMNEQFICTDHQINIYYNKEQATNFLSTQNIEYDFISYDLDFIFCYCNTATSMEISSDIRSKILDFINIATDILNFYHKKVQEETTFKTVYDKLFFGENLLHNSNKRYVPFFDKKELESLKHHIRMYINCIQPYLFPHSN